MSHAATQRCTSTPGATALRCALSGSLLLAATLHAPPGAAQAPGAPAARAGDVVVVGRDTTERNKQIEKFVRGMTAGAGTGPLPRFEQEKLCPVVIGLDQQSDTAINARIRRVATAVKVAVADETCRYPNTLVIFADAKATVTTALRKRYPGLFRDERGDPIVVGKGEEHVAAWHVRGNLSRDGVLIPGHATVSRTTSGPSYRIKSMTRPAYLMSIVVIERQAVNGLTATQIADYAAMRALSDASPAGAGKTSAPTILTVLDSPMGSATPLSMTTWDFTFLRGLYASPVMSLSTAQRGAIGTYMRHELDRPGDDTR